MLSETGLARSTGTTSSLSPSGTHVTRTTPFQRYARSGRSLEDITLVDSFSGRSYTIHECCTCTGYLPPLNGQMSFFSLPSGARSSTPSEEVRCVKCNLVKPYRITSASM